MGLQPVWTFSRRDEFLSSAKSRTSTLQLSSSELSHAIPVPKRLQHNIIACTPENDRARHSL